MSIPTAAAKNSVVGLGMNYIAVDEICSLISFELFEKRREDYFDDAWVTNKGETLP